jgi:hypothetical protein
MKEAPSPIFGVRPREDPGRSHVRMHMDETAGHATPVVIHGKGQ